MVDQARVEAFVVQVGIARGLISQAQLVSAQSRSGGSLLARLTPLLTAPSRSALQALYQQALASERAGGDSGAHPAPLTLKDPATFGAEKTRSGDPVAAGGLSADETQAGAAPSPSLAASAETYLGTPSPLRAPPQSPALEATFSGSMPGLPGSGRLEANETYASFVLPGPPSLVAPSAAVTQAGSSSPIHFTPDGETLAGAPQPKPATRGADPDRTLSVPKPSPQGAQRAATARARPAAPAPSGPAPEAGERVGVYETIRELGRGGMGIVYEARDTRSEERVALKLMIVTRKTTEDDVSRFKIEARAALKLDHPNLVRVFEQGVTGEGHWFTAMEFVPGEDLDQVLKREGALESEAAAEIALDLADALAYAHEQSVLHRDIKPQNVMIDEEGVPRLTDFGLAKLRDDDMASLTASGTLLGTPAYMSPEQATGGKRDIDERTDVYCLGATLYHMLTGKPPFERPSLTSLLLAITSEKPVPPSQILSDVDRDLETIVLKCLEKERDGRYSSMRALGRDLNRWLRALDIVAQRPSAIQNFGTWAAGNRPLVGVVVAASLVVAATLAYAFSRGPTPQLAGASPTPKLSSSESPPAASPSPSLPPPAKTGPAKTGPAKTGPAKTEEVDSPTVVTKTEPSAKSTPQESKTEDPQPSLTPEPSPTPEPSQTPGPSSTPGPLPSPAETPAPSPAEPSATPAATPPAPVPADRVVLPASEPPAWLKRRLTHMRKTPKKLYVLSWRDALEEAGARRAPILLINLHHGVSTLTRKQLLATAKQVERVNTSAVAVVAQFPHPPPGARTGPRGPGPGARPGGPGPKGTGAGPPNSDASKVCPYFPPLFCVDHERLQARTVEPGRGECQLRIYASRGQQVLSESPNEKTAHQKNKRFALTDKAFAAALAEAATETGILLKASDLEGAGLDLSKADAERSRSKTVPIYSRHANRSGPLGSWARLRLREICDVEIQRAKGDPARLDALAKRFEADTGCLGRISAAR